MALLQHDSNERLFVSSFCFIGRSISLKHWGIEKRLLWFFTCAQHLDIHQGGLGYLGPNPPYLRNKRKQKIKSSVGCPSSFSSKLSLLFIFFLSTSLYRYSPTYLYRYPNSNISTGAKTSPVLFSIFIFSLNVSSVGPCAGRTVNQWRKQEAINYFNSKVDITTA